MTVTKRTKLSVSITLALAIILLAPYISFAQGYIMARPRLVRRISADGSGSNRDAWISNAGFHATLLAFPVRALEEWHQIDLRSYDAILCVRCTGPSGRLPLMVQVRAVTDYWTYDTSMPELVGWGEWYTLWSDGYELLFDGPGWECVRVKAELDYMLQVRNAGLVLISLYDRYPTAGRTYRLAASDVIMHLRRRG